MKAMHGDAQLENGCAQLQLALSARQLAKLRAQLTLLAKWNRAMNLTAIAPRDMPARHILDSLSVSRYVRGDSLCDIGSGGGFPGVPLAIAFPHWRVTLVERRAKRAEFLRYARDELALPNVQVVCDAVQDYQPRAQFATLIARAFAPFAELMRATAHLHHCGGRILAMKGKHPRDEISAYNNHNPKADVRGASSGMTIRAQQIRAPMASGKRHLIIVDFAPRNK